jgi:hypothetical protein
MGGRTVPTIVNTIMRIKTSFIPCIEILGTRQRGLGRQKGKQGRKDHSVPKKVKR